MTRLIPVLSLATAVLSACADSAPVEEWSGTIEQLPGGGVRVTNPPTGLWTEDTAWRLVPERHIGAMEGAGPDVFSEIAGIAVDDGGKIFVLDRQSNELRIFAADGGHLRTVGRSGAGPGEYRQANGLVWAPPDTLIVVDASGRRYNVLTSAGDYVRSVPRSLTFYGWICDCSYYAGRIYEQSTRPRPDGTYQVAFIGTAVTGEAAAASNDSSGSAGRPAATDSMPVPMPEGPQLEPYSLIAPGFRSFVGVPFAPIPVFGLAGDGTILLGHGHEFRFSRTTLAGDTIMEILVRDAVAPSVSDGEIDEFYQSEVAVAFRQRGGEMDLNRIPGVKPFFDDLRLDDEGNVWASTPAEDSTLRFAIFDPDGRFLGHVSTVGLERAPYTPWVVRGDKLYVIGTDDLGVQRVQVFRIEKPAV